MQFLSRILRTGALAVPALFIVVLACSTTPAVDEVTDDAAIEQVRRYLLTTPIEGDQGNPSCLSLVERQGPRSIQWVVTRPNDDTLRVEVRTGGAQLRDFAWAIDAKSMEISPESSFC